MSTVNIIMATYQGERFLSEQIESILQSGYTDWCLYLADDGSTDRTVEIAVSYAKKYPERIFIYKNEKNLGCTKNFLYALQKVFRNRGNQVPSGNMPAYYMFCDQDDVWMSDKIGQTLSVMRQMEQTYGTDKPAAVFTDVRVVNENLLSLHRSFYEVSKLNTANLKLSRMLMENKMIGCTVMMNESLVALLETIPEQARYHDWWISLLAASFGHIAYHPQVTMYYRQHGNNVVGTGTFADYVKNRISSRKHQKTVLLQTERQAAEFLQLYGGKLSGKNRKLVERFASLQEKNWFLRRVFLIRYQYFKSGLLRNIGLFFIL